jgi:endonuclease YncB( thermonuclease family)
LRPARATATVAALAALFLLTPPEAVTATAPETFRGLCTAVADGDTITVMRDGEAVKVRLEGIDAPERGRPFSRKARSTLASYVLKQEVTVRVKELDRYGRTVGRVFVHGTDTSLAMVEAGLAWHFVRYSDEAALAAAERAARARGKNLWSQPDPEPPWVERRPTAEGGDTPRPVDEPGAVTYHGNRRSRVFHGPWCQHYHCQNCTVVFHSREAALEAGFRPGGQCNP